MTHPIDLEPILGGAQLHAVAEEPEFRIIRLTIHARDGQGYRLMLTGAHIARRSLRFGLLPLPQGGQIAWWLVAGNQLMITLVGGHFLTLQAEALELAQMEDELYECSVR